MRFGVVFVSSLLVFTACGRSEEPGSRPARSATVVVPAAEPPRTEPAATAPKAETPPAPAKPRCSFPTPAEPAPVAAKAKRCPADPSGNLDLKRGHVTFLDAPGRPKVEVELARTDASRERGLMYRTGMPDDDGMLFTWSDESMRTFWMRNTCIPLDMLFLDKDGFIVGVLEQVPTLNDDPRAVPCPAAHVLELNAGWARSHDVKSGQRVQIED